MNCDEIQQKLTPFLFRELKVDVTHKIQEHVRECPACHVEAERLTRAIRFLKVDLGIEPPPERMERLLAEFRPKFSARSSKRSFHTEEGSGSRGFQVTWTGLASALVPTLAIAGLVFMADVGGIRSRLLPPEDDEVATSAGNRPRPPEWERRPGGSGGGSDGGDPGPGQRDPSVPRVDDAARVEKLLDGLQARVVASWERDQSLPESIVDPRERSALGTRADLRAKYLPEGAAPERAAAGLLLASALHAEAADAEAKRIAAALEDPAVPGYLVLAALRAATIWRLGAVGPKAVRIVGDAGRATSVRTAAAKALAACHDGGSLEDLVGAVVSIDLPEETREAVLTTLGRLEVEASTEALRAIADRADRADVRLAALALVADRIEPAEVQFVLESLARFDEPRDQIRVLGIAGRIGGDHARIWISQNVLGYGGHPEPVLRAAIVQLAAISRRLDLAEATLLPVWQNQGLPPSVRALAIAGIPGRDASREIAETLRSGADAERAAAAEMLLWLPATGRDALAKALADPSPEVRRLAALGFASGGHAPKEALLALVQNDPAPEVRAAALAAVAPGAGGLQEFAGDPAVVQVALEEILALPCVDLDWTGFQVGDAPPDPYGRPMVRFEPGRLLEGFRRTWGLPYEIEGDGQVATRSVVARITPPFLTRRELLTELLAAAGLDASFSGDRILVRPRE